MYHFLLQEGLKPSSVMGCFSFQGFAGVCSIICLDLFNRGIHMFVHLLPDSRLSTAFRVGSL